MATDRIIEHVERLRQRPEEERHKIALGLATGLTAIVAIGWATALATSGTLALNSAPAPVEERTPEAELSESFTRTSSAFSELMGAAGAAFKGDGEAALRIIDSRTSSTLTEDPAPVSNETVISF